MRAHQGLLAALGVVCVLVATTGCGSSGVQPIPDGSYEYLLSSSDSGAGNGGQPDVATMRVAGTAMTLTQSSGNRSVAMGEPAAEFLLCPPTGRGQPRRLDGPVTVGRVTLTSPAVFGNCDNGTRPARITLVDLDSVDVNLPKFPFTRFVAFCNTTDADC